MFRKTNISDAHESVRIRGSEMLVFGKFFVCNK